MAQVHIRIVAALIALSVLAVTVLGAIYMYREAIAPEQERKDEVKKIMEKKGPQIDPGKKIHDQAMDLIRRREMEAAREKLTEIIEVYRDSERYPAARAVLGEMNLDRLFDRRPMPGKLEYTVAARDSLNALAGKFRTSIAYIKRVNNLLGAMIHPGDRLVVYPLEFEVEVDLETKRLTALKDGRFFKDYTIVGHHLPVSKMSREATLGEVYGKLGEKKVPPHTADFSLAPKWIQTAGRGTRPGIIFCPEPPAPAEGSPPAQAGIYLSREDMEELATILRPGITIRFLKTGKS
jgi:LysM repeat protein